MFEHDFPTFELWLAAIDKFLMEKIMLGHRDLPDRLWRDQYDDGVTPNEAIENLLGSFDDEHIEETLANISMDIFP